MARGRVAGHGLARSSCEDQLVQPVARTPRVLGFCQPLPRARNIGRGLDVVGLLEPYTQLIAPLIGQDGGSLVGHDGSSWSATTGPV